MSSWQVGAVTITKIVEAESPIPLTLMLPKATAEELAAIDWIGPFVDARGRLVLSVHGLVVKTPERTIMVDTCVGNDRQGRGVPTWNGLQTRFLEDFRAAGFRPEAVDTVLCTHLHSDHVGWNTHLVDGTWVPTFPNARYLLERGEYEHWRADGEPGTEAMLADSITPVRDAGLLELIDVGAGYRVCDEIELIPTPGHTPGHVSVRIVSEGEQALITGDFMHHPSQIARPDWSASSDFDAVLGEKSRRATLDACCEAGALVIGTHFPGPTAGRLRRVGGTYAFEV